MSVAEYAKRDSYAVPRQFGMRSVLTAMALFAALFTFIRWSNQPPEIPLFYAFFFLVIAVAQMVYERRPRLASIVAGGLYLPFCFYIEPSIRQHLAFAQWSENALMLFIAGGFLAYLGGTLAAGVYLLSDLTCRAIFKRR